MKRISLILVLFMLCSCVFGVLAEGETETTVAEITVVSPPDGALVHFHTAAQLAFLSNPYADGVIDTPAVEVVDGIAYSLDGNPYDSSDLETRKRIHPDYSIPNPIVLSWMGPETEGYHVELATDKEFSQDLVTFETGETALELYNLYLGTTYYWRVAPSEAEIGKAAVHSFTTSSTGPRNIYIDGATNVRDLGGYELADGSGRIRQGLIYRGGRLNLSNADRDKVIFREDPDYFELTITEKGMDTLLNQLGVKTELDVRLVGEDNEIGNMNDDRIEGLTYISIPMSFAGGGQEANNLTRLENPQRIKEIFELLADESVYPIYFHCNIGTDRTGCLAYLLGALLGMSEEDLYINYVFSNFGSISGGTNRSGRPSTFITGPNGYGTTVMSYPGDTLSEKTANALMDICGLSRETLDKVCEIMVEQYEVTEEYEVLPDAA